MSITTRKLADISSMQTGKLNSNAAVPNGIFPFFTCAQETYSINKAAFNTEAVLLGGNNANGVFPLKYYNGEFNAYQRTYIIETLDRNVLDTRYLFYALQPALSKFQAASIGAATQYLTKSILDNFKIGVPDLYVQKRIVNLLSSYDDLIENNRRRIALLEESARLLYREWFVHFRFPGHEHVKITNGLPLGWERRSLGDVVEVVKESVSPSDFEEHDIHIGLEHIPRRSFTLADWEPAEGLASGKWRFKEGDILFCKIRPYFHKVGFTIRGGLVSSDAIVWRVQDEAIWPVVLCATSSDHFVAVASKTVREGSKMPRVDWKVLQQYEIPIPPGSLHETFNVTVRTVVAQCKTLALQNKALVFARNLLLPRLMNGEIKV